MSATNTFLQKFSSSHTIERNSLAEQFAIEQSDLLDRYTSGLRSVEAAYEGYFAFVEPIVAGLSGLPDEVVIEAIKNNGQAGAEVVLLAKPGVSISSLLMDYPAIPFSIASSGKMVEVDANKENQTVYSGLMVVPKPGSLHWQSTIGGQEVSFSLHTNELAVEPWNNPVETGAPVAGISLGAAGESSLWQSVGQNGGMFWVEPSNPQALALLDNAKAWKQNASLSAQAREAFNERLAGIPALHSAQAKIVVNALFGWATSSQELPLKEDFAAWTPPRGNVLAMRSPQDWTNLVADKPQHVGFANSAQEKIHTLSERLPNIWRFTDEAGIAILCDAMAETRTRLQAGQSLSI